MTESQATEPSTTAARYVPGCLLFLPGFFGAGMIAVLIGKIVAVLRRAPACEGLPLCGWEWWFVPAGLVGGLGLSIYVIWRIGQSDRDARMRRNSERG